MASIDIAQFSGELPNIPAYELPEGNAQQALFCDFAQKDLRPLRQGQLYKTMSAAVKGLYSEDGLTFFTWPTETWAFKSPVIGDTYGRVYFMNSSGFKVTTYGQASVSGGGPSEAFNVGVPTPTAAPVLSIVDRTTLRGYASTSVVVKAWYEYLGKRYDEATVTTTAAAALKTYTFTAPTKTAYVKVGNTYTGTPDTAGLAVSFTLNDNTGKAIFSVVIPAGSTTRTSSLPGGVELSLAVSGTTGTITLDWGVYETRAYVYTVENTWNEESGPSPAAIIDVTYMQDVRVVVSPPSFTGYRPLGALNIYRTFGTTANYSKVAATVESTNTFLDRTFKASDVGSSLQSLDWQPPVSGLYGLVAMANGVFAAFKNNQVYFSEPYRPHAWPYSMAFPHNIRGIRPGSQALVVTTAAGTYNVLGTNPKSMSQQMLPTPQAGVSHRSMTMVDGAVVFASNDGFVTVEGSKASTEISQKFFSRDDWRARYGSYLSTMQFAYHDGFVVAAAQGSPVGFIVRLDEAAGTFSQFNQQVDAMFYLPVLDTLYYSVGNQVYRFRAGTNYTLDWWSKEYVLPGPLSFAGGYIRCSGSVTVMVYADNALWHTFTANGDGFFRLPAGKRANRWSFRFQTTGSVQRFTVAQSLGELRNV